MDPDNGLTAGGSSTSFNEKVMSGLSDFRQSVNLSVLVNDRSLKDAYAKAMNDGELPTNRARVLILGEPRAGKTSLLNRLLGRDFDRQEQSTHGIETRMCHVTDVDRHWKELADGTRSDDIRECASALTAMRELRSDRQTAHLRVKKEDPLRRTDPASSAASASDVSNLETWAVAKNIIKFSLSMAIIAVVASAVGMLRYGFAIFVWSCILVMTCLQNYNMAYRFGTSVCIISVLIEAMIRPHTSVEKHSCDTDNGQAIWFIWNASFYLFNSAMAGVFVGLGCRTGIAVALSACVCPMESPVAMETFLNNLESSWNMLIPYIIVMAAAVISVQCYLFCTANDRWHSSRICLCCCLLVLLFAMVWKADCTHRTHLYIFLNGMTITIGGSWGVLFGRRAVLKYGFDASYVTKKTVGFVYGLCLARICGWTLRVPSACLPSLVFYALSVTAHPLYDLHIAYKIRKSNSTFPVKAIRGRMKAAIKGRPILETKLSLWDFAGDALYHCAHHVFMPDRALYIVVFNLEAAVSDVEEELNRLLFWLHSICAHARHPDAVIMIVGTHEASVPVERKLCFAEDLHSRITSPFCRRLVLNPKDDRPLFLVENSDPSDLGVPQLRAEILRRVGVAEYTQEIYPIKFLHFYDEIQKRRKLAGAMNHSAKVMPLKQVEELAKRTCNIKGADDFKKLLQFFSEAGEIIHKDDDKNLREHVVIDPQFLVDVMKKLVRIPRSSERSHHFAMEWRNYETSGIVTEDLLHHIYEDMSNRVPLLTHLLQSYDLMCPVSPVFNPNSSQKSYVVPAMLPPFRGDFELFWESTTNEEAFYFDFGFFHPSSIYYRLLTRCMTHACLGRVTANSQPLIFADRCRFHVGTGLIFKLQLESRPSQQKLLSVTVLAFEQKEPVGKLLSYLVNVVREIVARDFPNLNFTFGPRCPFCVEEAKEITSSSDGCGKSSSAGTIHVLKMAGQDKPYPSTSPVVLLCNMKRYELKLPGIPSAVSQHSSSQLPQRVLFTMETPITKIPPDLFLRVCSLLNNSSMTRNWRTLAGELGKDAQDVSELDNAQVGNPTECLLREWSMTSGGVTVRDLVDMLARPSLQRMDIIAEVRNNMTPT